MGTRHPDIPEIHDDSNFLQQEQIRADQERGRKNYLEELYISSKDKHEIRLLLRHLVELSLKEDMNGILVTVRALYREFGHDNIMKVLDEALPGRFGEMRSRLESLRK